MTKYMPDEERFLAKVVKSDDGCWTWTGASYLGEGLPYGRFALHGETIPAHRAAYVLFCGDISSSVVICHHCDNPKCVRPDHLYAGTATDNNRDTVVRNRRNPARVIGNTDNYRGERNNKTTLTRADVLSIRTRALEGETAPRLAAEFKVNPETIRRIVSRRTWGHVP